MKAKVKDLLPLLLPHGAALKHLKNFPCDEVKIKLEEAPTPTFWIGCNSHKIGVPGGSDNPDFVAIENHLNRK